MPSNVDPAIFVHALIGSKPVVFRAMEQLRIGRAAAVGHLVMFWGSASMHLDDGVVSRATDAQLDEWGGWTGKRGAFAAFVRGVHVDSEGRIFVLVCPATQEYVELPCRAVMTS